MANLAKLVLLCLKLRFLPENEQAPPEKTYQILNIKLLVCLGLCLWPENERAPPEKTYQILNIKLLVCLGLCLRSKNEICVHIIYDLWSRAQLTAIERTRPGAPPCAAPDAVTFKLFKSVDFYHPCIYN